MLAPTFRPTRRLSTSFPLTFAALLAVIPASGLGLVVTGCDAESSASEQPGPDGGPPPADGSPNGPEDGGNDGSDDDDPNTIRFADAFPRAAHARPRGGWAVLLDRPVYLRKVHGRPDRQIALLDALGKEQARLGPATGRELIDVAVHGSGALTALEASDDGYFLVRFDAAGARLRETPLVDDAIYTDLPKMHEDDVHRSRIEPHTHDAGRILAASEGVVLATRTGRHSVVAYGVAFDPASGYAPAWRTLVVPAHGITQVALIGGSYDTFGQLDAPYVPHLARDASGTIYVGVQHARLEGGLMVKAFESVFGEKVTTDPDRLDLFVTRITHGGERLGISVVGTPEDDQLYGLRSETSGAMVLGRSELWNAEGTGFEALVGHVASDGSVTVDRFDVERSDIAFDALRTSSGDVIAVGARGYSQNPRGASVSEESYPFALVRSSGATTRALSLPQGPRHGEARFVMPTTDGRLLVGGMLDGPGTHSADGDQTLLRTRGFIRFVTP